MQFDRLKQREFIMLLGGAAAWPQAVLAQTKKRPLVGWLSYGESDVAAKYLGLLLKGMRELGHIEGRDFEMVYRSADFHVERLPKNATDTIPIVVPVLADPVGLGFVASEARPGGNVTGIAPYVKGLPAKQVELAREVVPGATRIGLVDDVNDPKAHPAGEQRRRNFDEFVPKKEIDELYLNSPYYLVPDGEVGQQAFAVIREAIRKEGMVALGRVVFTSREHVIALEPRGKGLLGITLRYPYEVRKEDEYFHDIADEKIPKVQLWAPLPIGRSWQWLIHRQP
jgi:Ku70/Ku80 beta-barrel domain/ABC transporter substrate binding protein